MNAAGKPGLGAGDVAKFGYVENKAVGLGLTVDTAGSAVPKKAKYDANYVATKPTKGDAAVRAHERHQNTMHHHT